MSTTMAAHGVAPSEARREADFLEKLLQIRDQVYASKHPRIQLPPKVLEQVAPRSAQYTPPSSRPTTNGTPNGAHSKPLPPRPESSSQYHPSTNEFVSPAQASAQRPYSAKSASSGIDPVLLTKSDHLIRAELQLRRQQIERALKDQNDKKGRANDPLVEDREPRLDVEGILNKALELVKPLSGLQITVDNSERAESFDENSYYSSKANSWSSDEADANQKASSADATSPFTLQAKRSAIEAQLTTAKPVSPPHLKSKQVEPTVIDLDEEAYEPADDIEIYEPEPAQVSEEADESDYSPPPANVTPNGPSKGPGRERGFANNGGANGSSRRQSPVGNPQPIQNTRKRRRDEKRDEKRRQQAGQTANKRVVRSPEPYIKEEPQSPPLFAAYPDSQPSKRRALQPLPNDVEIISAREGRTQPVYYREQEPASRAFRPYDEPSSPTVIRAPIAQRDQDLRRVASLQYARRAYSPLGAEPHPPEVRQVRAASHAFVERPMEQPVYREASVRPSAAPRYMRERSRSPIPDYLPRAQSPMAMAPPLRRIVMDQFGNKYYAAPVDVRESVAPPSRRMEPEPYYERAVTRAPVRQELYEEDVQMMPPPPRRYVEAPESEIVETRQYRQREASHRPVELEYRPQEIMERRSVMHYEEMGPPREYAPAGRAYSVRPEVVRRELPAEYAPVRYESAQPGSMRVSAAPRYREVSVVQQDPFDDRRYALAPAPAAHRRYIEEGVAERQPVELAQELYAGEPRRVSYRY